jgi:hypothetical protein
MGAYSRLRNEPSDHGTWGTTEERIIYADARNASQPLF